MTKDQREAYDFLAELCRTPNGKEAKTIMPMTWAQIYLSYEEVLRENKKHERFTRWLIGELIKGELSEEAVMDKLVEFGFAECKDGYISVKVEI